MTSQALVPAETKRTAAHLGDKAEFERLIAHELSGLGFRLIETEYQSTFKLKNGVTDGPEVIMSGWLGKKPRQSLFDKARASLCMGEPLHGWNRLSALAQLYLSPLVMSGDVELAESPRVAKANLKQMFWWIQFHMPSAAKWEWEFFQLAGPSCTWSDVLSAPDSDAAVLGIAADAVLGTFRSIESTFRRLVECRAWLPGATNWSVMRDCRDHAYVQGFGHSVAINLLQEDVYGQVFSGLHKALSGDPVQIGLLMDLHDSRLASKVPHLCDEALVKSPWKGEADPVYHATAYNDQFFKNSLHVESVDKMLVKPEPTEGERLAAFFGRSEHDAHKPQLVVKAPMATKELRELHHGGQSALFSIIVVDGHEKVYESFGFRLRLTSVDAQLTSQRFGVVYNYRYPASSILACLDAYEAVLTAVDKFILNCMLAHRLMFEEDQATLYYQENQQIKANAPRLTLLSDWDLLEDA